jgi:hypothetical protein
MVDWKRMLKADPIGWLLEEDNPSVRFFTLTGLLDEPQKGALASRAKKQIMQVGVVPKILSRQKEGGYWETAEDFYIRTKYNGTVWQLIILAELGADKDDTRIKKACEFILQWSQDRESGGFSYRGSGGNGGFHSAVVPCLTGNMVWSLLRFGYFDDPRVRRGIDWIVEYQRFDDAVEKAPKGWPYDKREPCWGKHTCHMGVVKTLKALAEIPAEQRTKDFRNMIENAAEYLLVHHIHKRSHDLSRVSKPGWLKFGFPLMANTDVLEILGILTGLGYRDSRMQEALELVISKQDEQGRWKLESTYNGRFQVNIEQKGKPSKWITLNALRVLKGFYD